MLFWFTFLIGILIYINIPLCVFRFSQIVSENGMGMALGNSNNNGGEFRPHSYAGLSIYIFA